MENEEKIRNCIKFIQIGIRTIESKRLCAVTSENNVDELKEINEDLKDVESKGKDTLTYYIKKGIEGKSVKKDNKKGKNEVY